MITIVAGTNRPQSRTLSIARTIAGIYQDIPVESRLLDLARLPAEIFDPGSYQKKPDSFMPFSRAVLSSRGLVVVTPEYNGSFPGALKYFIDMLPFPESFQGRPVCFVGLAAGAWGALRPVEQLSQIFAYRKAVVCPARVLIPSVAESLDSRGQLSSPEMLERLEAQAREFDSFSRRNYQE